MAVNVEMNGRGRRFSVERRFEGSVLDIAVARRFARVTALWWSVRPEPVEYLVEELARRAVCGTTPAFRVALSIDGDDVQVRVDAAPFGHEESRAAPQRAAQRS